MEHETQKESGGELLGLGSRIEGRIVLGKAEIISEEERNLLRDVLVKKNMNLDVMSEGKTLDRNGKGVNSIMAAGDKLERTLGGRDEMKEFLAVCLKQIVTEGDHGEIRARVEDYFVRNTRPNEKLIHYDMNSGDIVDKMIVAIIPAANRIVKIASAKSREDALKWQTNEQAADSLRERVIMGWEKTKLASKEKEVPVLSEPLVLQEIQRGEYDAKTRTLPVGALEKIVKILLG